MCQNLDRFVREWLLIFTLLCTKSFLNLLVAAIRERLIQSTDTNRFRKCMHEYVLISANFALSLSALGV